MSNWWYDEDSLKLFKEWANKSHRHLLRTKGMRLKTPLEMSTTRTREELGLSPCKECDEARKWTIDFDQTKEGR